MWPLKCSESRYFYHFPDNLPPKPVSLPLIWFPFVVPGVAALQPDKIEYF